MRLISLIAVLYGFWLILSGHYTSWLLSVGVICSVLIALLIRKMGILDEEGHPIQLIVRAILYWPWLIIEIIKSSWNVTKIILSPSLPISPTLLKVRGSQRSPLGVYTYANSITLTPGTISVEVDGDEIIVHALTSAGADDLAQGVMDRRVSDFVRTS
ncbi:MAG: Na+/H+ antiporter subunit E [Fimbriimonadaceae bacterium]|nr:Na+/H+ antiporter subunit E [Alphaproteobacteria bacterium]